MASYTCNWFFRGHTASGRIIAETGTNNHAENRAILQRHISTIILPEAKYIKSVKIVKIVKKRTMAPSV